MVLTDVILREKKKELCLEVRLRHCPVLLISGEKKGSLLRCDSWKLPWFNATWKWAEKPHH